MIKQSLKCLCPPRQFEVEEESLFCRRCPFDAYFPEIAEGIWGCNIPDALAGSLERLNITMIDGGQRTADASPPAQQQDNNNSRTCPAAW